MSADIYVVPDALSSRLLKPVQGHLNDAKNALTRLNTCLTYYGPDGYSSLYPSSVYTEANRLAARIRAIENKINRYASILNSAPEELSEIDAGYKGSLSTWGERLTFDGRDTLSSGKFFGTVSVVTYALKREHDNFQKYYLKAQESSGIKLSSGEFKKIKGLADPANEWLEDNRLRKKPGTTEYYDTKTGKKISKKKAGFYEREGTLAEVAFDKKKSISLYENTSDVVIGFQVWKSPAMICLRASFTSHK